jgi:hypothetical protein
MRLLTCENAVRSFSWWVRGYGYGSPPDPATTTDFETYGLAR